MRCSPAVRASELGVHHRPRDGGAPERHDPRVVAARVPRALDAAAAPRAAPDVERSGPTTRCRAAPRPSRCVRRPRAAERGAAAAAVSPRRLVLRVTGLGSVQPDPFYDAAVRSMGESWHAFLFGALEPGGTVAIDKPPPRSGPRWRARSIGFTTPVAAAAGGARRAARRSRCCSSWRACCGARRGDRLGGGARRAAGLGAHRAQRHHGLAGDRARTGRGRLVVRSARAGGRGRWRGGGSGDRARVQRRSSSRR